MASRILIILGKRGAGKSWRLKEELRLEPRVLLYDTLQEPTYNGMTRVGEFSELCARLAQRRKIFSIAYNGHEQRPRAEDFDLFCRAAYACTAVCVAVDEIDLYISSQFIPESLDKVISLGRHRDLSFYCATRRPKEIHPLIRSQAHTVISFQQTEPGDLDWCRAVMGENADRLPGLSGHDSIIWNDSDPLTSSREEEENSRADPLTAPQEVKS